MLTSSLKGTKYIWTRNGSTISTATSDKFEASQAGAYTVRVEGVSGCGSTPTPSEELTITINAVQADFSVLKEEVCAGGRITFNNTSSGNDLSYRWDFGGSGTSTAKDPTHTFNLPSGTTSREYKVKLTVRNGDGCESTREKTIKVSEVVADFAFPSGDLCAGSGIKFTDASTGEGKKYEWNFGDPGSGNANTSAAASPTHVYKGFAGTSKTFTVTLKVTNSAGCESIRTRQITVREGPDADMLDVDAGFNTPFVRCTTNPLDIDYVVNARNNSSTKSLNRKYTIDWGDKTPIQEFADFTDITHTYKSLGAFRLVFTVEGTNGCTSSTTYEVYNGSNPSLKMGSPGNTVGCAPQTYTFPIEDVLTNTPNTKYTFWFDDGTPVMEFTQENVPSEITHIFTTSSCGKNGNQFTLYGKAENPCGGTEVTVSSIKIGASPQVNFGFNATGICVRSEIPFSNTTVSGNSITNTGNCTSQSAFTWKIEPATGWTLPAGTTLASENINIKFTSAGVYRVSLKSTNGCGFTEVTKEVNVMTPPKAIFAMEHEEAGCKNLPVTINNMSEGDELSYQWSVSPNSGFSYLSGNATSNNPIFNFTEAGTYTITLLASNSCAISTATTELVVKDKPVVTLPGNQTYCGPQTLKFGAASTAHKPTYDARNGTISAYSWVVTGGADPVTFTGGTNAQSQYPEIRFPSAGTYTVTLQATNECGVSEAKTQTITIHQLSNNTLSANQSICVGSSAANITGSEPIGGDGNYTYKWYKSTTSASTGFAEVAGENNKDFAPGAVPEKTWYYREVISAGCTVASAPVEIDVKPAPAAPAVASQVICRGSKATLKATGAGGNITWYDANNTKLAENTDTYETSALTQSATYYAVIETEGCSSPRTEVKVEVQEPISNNLLGADQNVCLGQPVTVSSGSTPTGGSGTYTYFWEISTTSETAGFASAPGTNSGPDYTLAAANQTTWFRRSVTGGVCDASLSNVLKVEVTPAITGNIITGEQTICENNIPTRLSGPEPTGGEGSGTFTYTWEYSTTSASTNYEVIPNATGREYAPAALAVTTWFRRTATSGGCQVASAPVKVTVNAAPSAPTVANTTMCSGSIATLTISTPTGSYDWFEDQVSATPLFTGTQFKTPVLTATTTYYVQLTDATGCHSTRTPVTVTVYPPLAANTIGASQVICIGEKPADLVGSTPTGGDGTYTYTWEHSTDNRTWTAAPGISSSKDYQPPVLTQETWYRRRVSSGGCDEVSVPVQVVVNSLVSNNTISASQTICTGTRPTALSGTAPTGGDGNFTYRWEMSLNGPTGLYTTAPGISDQAGYEPAALTQTTWFRRVVSSGDCPNPSAAVEITVQNNVANNLLSGEQTVCSGSSGIALTGTLPTGGNGVYTYIWEVSTLNAQDGFTPAPGTRAEQHYTTGTLTQTSWLRRRVLSAPCADHTSVAIQVTVNPTISNNTISAEQIICAGTAPAELTGSTPLGGDGTYVYLWEYSTESSTSGFRPAIGMNNGQHYLSGVLYETTWFRRTVVSDPCQPVASAPIKVTVSPIITNNIISGNQTLCTGSAPSLITALVPAGGDGTYAYSWEASTDGVTYAVASGNSTQATYQAGTLLQTTWFRRVVSSGNCTNASAPVIVTVNELLTANIISEDQLICMGATPMGLTGTDPEGGTGSYTYLWESSTVGESAGYGPATGTNTGVSYFPGTITQTTWYRRVVTAGPCPPHRSNIIKITVTPPISNNRVSLPQSICEGTLPAPLTGSAPTGGNGVYRYVWESSITSATAGFTTATGTSDQANYTPGQTPVTTWFRRAVYSEGCVQISAPIQITVTKPITNNVVHAEQVICVGTAPLPFSGTTPEGGTGNYQYLWEVSHNNISYSPAAGTNNEADYTAGPLTVTTWFRRIVTAGPCAASVSNEIKIDVNTPVTNNTIGSPQHVCAGVQPATLFGSSPAGGSRSYTYLWEYSTTSATTGFATAPGTYDQANYTPPKLMRNTWFRRKIISLPCQESISATVLITVDPQPLAPHASGATICPGKSARFTATALAATYSIQWFDQEEGGLPLATGETYNTAPLLATTDFYVQTVNPFGCPSDRVKVTAIVTEPAVDAGEDVTIIAGRTAQLVARGGATYKWSPAETLSDPTLASPVAQPNETTTYTVTVTTKEGCFFTDEVTVIVLPAVKISNMITMNGDGINETWYIENIEQYPRCQVQIFTRWGAKIFESTGYQVPWDGTHNGKRLPMAAYYYIIKLDEKEEAMSGSITLIK
ncbi:Ig-like domain-containing protein [Pontibacter beigongshangensis]|uniref:Ig-like domain-containing protein n=1 Tax=Pontibacter beigongshangensis TaxID=2574733 RepID=UPI001650490B|nr:PKD domain-containing protein [Pontibacter beigongshangensis]